MTLSESDLKRAHREPPRVKELLVYQLWSKLRPDWPPEKDWVPSEEEINMLAEIVTNLTNVKPIK